MPVIDVGGALSWVRGRLTHLHPRGRRWLKFLRSLTLDPDALPRPVAPPGPADFIICGAPRTGTTLVSAMLFQPPRVVTVMEPWDGMRLPPAQLFATIRESVARTGTLRYGKLDVEGLLEKGRVRWVKEGESTPALALEPEYLLGVKWPAFWRYLELLPRTKFLVCLRHPYEVISSFKKQGGRLVQGLNYDIAFNRRMNDELKAATRSAALRRVLLYDYVNERILPHLGRENVFTVRYERWFQEPETLLGEIGDFLGVELGSGPAAIRPPQNEVELTAEEIALVREHCRTAAALGYSLDDGGA
ncbi:hypothetical protein BH23GEM7_BH23GEM7_20070 [soil metagenome]